MAIPAEIYRENRIEPTQVFDVSEMECGRPYVQLEYVSIHGEKTLFFLLAPESREELDSIKDIWVDMAHL